MRRRAAAIAAFSAVLAFTGLAAPAVGVAQDDPGTKFWNIDVNHNREIAYWAARLGVKRSQLITAVAATGPRVRDVARYLRNRQERSAPHEGPTSRLRLTE